MTEKIKTAGRNTKKAVNTAYEVLAMSAAVAAAIKCATLPRINDIPVWQVVAGVILAGVVVKVFVLLNKD